MSDYDEDGQHELSQDDAREASIALGVYRKHAHPLVREKLDRAIKALDAFSTGSTKIVPEE